MRGIYDKIKKLAKDTSGSTLVAVLVSMVFIGIVAAGMVKNTSSQATATMSYGNVAAMESTVKSGLVATESYLLNSANVTAIEEHIAGFVNSVGVHRETIFPKDGGTAKARHQLADKQFFKSIMTTYNENVFPNNAMKGVGSFRIESGRNAGGTRSMKDAVAYYILNDVKIVDDNVFSSENAIYMAGELSDGNNGIHVTGGKATFDGHVRLQNKKAVFEQAAHFANGLTVPGGSKITFEQEVFVNGNAEFQDTVIFSNDAYFTNNLRIGKSGSVFEGKTHIDGNTTLQVSGNYEIFKDDASFGGDFTTDNSPQTSGNIYLNGNFSGNGGITSIGTDNGFYHSNNINYVVNNTDRFSGFDERLQDPSIASTKTLQEATMREKTRGSDPQLNIANIPVPTGGRLNAIGAITAAHGQPGNTNNFSIDSLRNTYQREINNPESPHIWNGHLVVEVNSGINFQNYNDVFDGKVIFLVGNNGQLHGRGGNFYQSGANASTLIHVSGSGNLESFGTSGVFRGLIHIDANSTNRQSFQWGPGSEIQGAVHNFSSHQGLVWNTGRCEDVGGVRVCDDPTTIAFNQEILNQFAGLVPCDDDDCSNGNKTVTIINGDLKLTPLGYYFR